MLNALNLYTIYIKTYTEYTITPQSYNKIYLFIYMKEYIANCPSQSRIKKKRVLYTYS